MNSHKILSSHCFSDHMAVMKLDINPSVLSNICEVLQHYKDLHDSMVYSGDMDSFPNRRNQGYIRNQNQQLLERLDLTKLGFILELLEPTPPELDGVIFNIMQNISKLYEASEYVPGTYTFQIRFNEHRAGQRIRLAFHHDTLLKLRDPRSTVAICQLSEPVQQEKLEFEKCQAPDTCDLRGSEDANTPYRKAQHTIRYEAGTIVVFSDNRLHHRVDSEPYVGQGDYNRVILIVDILSWKANPRLQTSQATSTPP